MVMTGKLDVVIRSSCSGKVYLIRMRVALGPPVNRRERGTTPLSRGRERGGGEGIGQVMRSWRAPSPPTPLPPAGEGSLNQVVTCHCSKRLEIIGEGLGNTFR